MKKEIKQAAKVLKEGGIIIYPTEGVYGLGCDPFNETAVLRLLKIKRRSVEKGLVLIASSWAEVRRLVKIDPEKCDLIKKNKKKSITWVFPITKKAPSWITGNFNSIAIRVTSHKLAKRICQEFGGPIVSTSANLIKQKPPTSFGMIKNSVLDKVDFVVSGRTDGLKKPTEICDVVTGHVMRG